MIRSKRYDQSWRIDYDVTTRMIVLEERLDVLMRESSLWFGASIAGVIAAFRASYDSDPVTRFYCAIPLIFCGLCLFSLSRQVQKTREELKHINDERIAEESLRHNLSSTPNAEVHHG